MSSNYLASLIITTYNWPLALQKILVALKYQTIDRFEIIIADDGSSSETTRTIEQARTDMPLAIRHIWQPDEGFQAAKIRNKAVVHAQSDYLIFLDGDCIPQPHFLERHIRLAEPGWLVAGNRILLNQVFTQQLLNDEKKLPAAHLKQWLQLKKQGYCNRVLPLLFLPIFPRKLQATRWRGVKTCNLGIWKEDFVNVNGFDETFTGWGYEDSDLIIRLFRAGIRRKEGRFALGVVHLWHPESDRSSQKDNYNRLLVRLREETSQAALGIRQYL